MQTNGLNKLARLLAARQDEATKNAPPPLEPDFPFDAVAFPGDVFKAVSSTEPPDAD
jgi:hypothetical protein